MEVTCQYCRKSYSSRFLSEHMAGCHDKSRHEIMELQKQLKIKENELNIVQNELKIVQDALKEKSKNEEEETIVYEIVEDEDNIE